ncbi:MAG TPA: hemerythrin domain-containing protein, partial [Puia sp.]|nr:hemerythrin domain-containing protein [Puia sp.]
IAQQALEFYDRELKYHFKQEEEYVFTLVPPDDPLRVQAENDHKKIHSLVESIKQNGGDIQYLKEFADLLEAHIRFEERILFNHLQEKMKPEELEELLLKINDVRSKLDP